MELDPSQIYDMASGIWQTGMGLGTLILIGGFLTQMKSAEGPGKLMVIVNLFVVLAVMVSFPSGIESTGEALYEFGQNQRSQLDTELDAWLKGVGEASDDQTVKTQGAESAIQAERASDNQWWISKQFNQSSNYVANLLSHLTPEAIVATLFWGLAKFFIWVSGFVRAGFSFLQQYLLLIGASFSPMMLSMFMWPALNSHAWNYVFTIIGLLMWPVAFTFADIFILMSLSTILQIAGLAGETTASAVGGPGVLSSAASTLSGATVALVVSFSLLTGIIATHTFAISLINYFMRGFASAAPGTGYRFGGAGAQLTGGKTAMTASAIMAGGAGLLGAAGALASPSAVGAGANASGSLGATANTAGTSLGLSGSSGSTGLSSEPSSPSTSMGNNQAGTRGPSSPLGSSTNSWNTPWSSTGSSQTSGSDPVSSKVFGGNLGTRSRPVSD